MSLLHNPPPLRGGLNIGPSRLPDAPMPDNDRANWFFRLGSQALKEGYWSVARGSFQSCIHRYGDCMEARYNLALCEIATGRHRLALEHLARAEQLQPDDLDVMARLIELAAIELHWASLGWYDPDQARDGELSLEPLAERHLPALHWQSRDPAIAANANFPALRSREAVEGWFNALQQEPGRYSYAVMHQTLGFAGLVGGNISDQLAWLYVWTGTDCQRQGIAPRALQLARRQLAAAGVQHILTAIYPDNQPSRTTFERADFQQLPQPGDGDGRRVEFWHSPLQLNLDAPDTDALQQQIDQLDAGFEVRDAMH